MPKNNLTDLSATNDSNSDIGGANIAENCSPGGINNAIRNMAGLLARAFNEADPTTKITAVKAANYIVAADADKITVGTTNPTLIQHNNTTSTTTITPDASGSLTVAGTANFSGVAQPSLNTTTTWDASAKQTCSVTASGATTVTLSNVSSLAVGTPLTLVVADASGASLTLAGTTFKYVNATAPTLNGTAGETLIVSMLVIGSNTVAAASVTVS